MLLEIIFKIIGNIAQAGMLDVLNQLAQYLVLAAGATFAYFIFNRGLKPYKVLPDQMGVVLKELAAMRKDMPSNEMLKSINLSAAKYDALHLRLDAYRLSIETLDSEVSRLQKRVRELEQRTHMVG